MTTISPTDQSSPDLGALLLQQGDLPAEVSGHPVADPAPPNFENRPAAASIVGQRFERDGRGAGSVSVLLYDSLPDIERAYQRLTRSVARDATAAGNTAQPIADVGDKALAARLALASSTYGKGQVAVVVFVRCHALVDISLNEWMGMTGDTAVAYAKRLDQRLATVVCT